MAVETWDLTDALGVIAQLDTMDVGEYGAEEIELLEKHLHKRWAALGTHLKVGVARTFTRNDYLSTDSVHDGFNSGHYAVHGDEIVTVIMLTTPVEEASQDDFLDMAVESVKQRKLAALESELKRAEEAAARSQAEIDRLKAKLAGTK